MSSRFASGVSESAKRGQEAQWYSVAQDPGRSELHCPKRGPDGLLALEATDKYSNMSSLGPNRRGVSECLVAPAFAAQFYLRKP